MGWIKVKAFKTGMNGLRSVEAEPTVSQNTRELIPIGTTSKMALYVMQFKLTFIGEIAEKWCLWSASNRQTVILTGNIIFTSKSPEEKNDYGRNIYI